MASKTSLLRADDTRVDGEGSEAILTRGRPLLRQSREAQSEARPIARLRLLGANYTQAGPCSCNVPLPGLPRNDWLNSTLSFRTKSDVQVQKYQKLERAIVGAKDLCCVGIRLPPGGLTKGATKGRVSQFSFSKWNSEKNTPFGSHVGVAWNIAADRVLSATFHAGSRTSVSGSQGLTRFVFTTRKRGHGNYLQHLWPEFDKHFRE